MDRKYSKTEMKQILRRDIGTSALTEQKIQEAYSFVRADAAMQRQGSHISSSVNTDRKTVNFDRAGGRRETGRRKLSSRRWMVLAAAVGVLAVSSVTVMAINGMFSKTVEQSGDTLSYKLEFNYDLTPNVVEAEAGYIPEGYEKHGNEKMSWSADGSGQNGITVAVLTAAELDQYSEWMDAVDVKDFEETTINGMDAHLITLDYDPERVTRTFDKRIYLFNETDGYVGVIFGGNDLSMEELKKVAEGLSFTKLDETREYVSAEEKESLEEEQEAYQELLDKSIAFGVPQEYIYETGTGVELWQLPAEGAESEGPGTARITVESAEIVDSAADFPQEYFCDYSDRIAPQLNEDGTIRPYTRVTYRIGDDGEQEEIARDEGVNRKFLKVTFKAENLWEDTIDFWAGAPVPENLKPVEGGNYQYEDSQSDPLNIQEDAMTSDNMAVYFDKSPYAGELSSHFFFCDLEAGETLEYTLLYVVDEDKLENLYLRFSDGGALALEKDGTYTRRYVKMDVS